MTTPTPTTVPHSFQKDPEHSDKSSFLMISEALPSQSTSELTIIDQDVPLPHTSSPETVISLGSTTLRSSDAKKNPFQVLHRKETLQEIQTLIRLSFPCILSYFLSFANRLVVTLFVGHLGANQLAAATLAVMYTNVLGYSIAYGLNTALDTLASQAFTCGDNPKAAGIFLQRALAINLLTAIPIALVWLYAEPLLVLCGQSQELASLSSIYILYLLPGLIPNLLNNCYSKFLQAQGLMKGPFYASLFVFPINLVCQFFLVRWLGFRGPPIGSVIADTLTCIIVMVYSWLYGKRGWHPLTRLAFRDWHVFMKLGFPGMLMICAEWWVFEIVALVAGWLGPIVLASQSVILNIAVLGYTLYYGISVACANRIGNFLGAGQGLLAKHTAYISFYLALCVAIGSSTGIILFRHSIGGLFTTDPDVIRTVASVIPLCALFQFADGGSCVLGGILRGCGQQKIGAMVNFLTYYVIGIPAVFVLVMVFHWGLFGIWVSLSAGLWTTMLFSGTYIFKFIDWEEQVRSAQLRVQIGDSEDRDDRDPETVPLLS